MILPHATFQESTVHPSTSISLLGGTLYDPANGKNGVVCDIHIRDGRIVDALHETPSRTLDLSGLIVMPGGVDIHSHVAGPKVCSGRRMRRILPTIVLPQFPPRRPPVLSMQLLDTPLSLMLRFHRRQHT